MISGEELMILVFGILVGVQLVLLIQEIYRGKREDEATSDLKVITKQLALEKEAMAKVFNDLTEERKQVFDETFKSE